MGQTDNITMLPVATDQARISAPVSFAGRDPVKVRAADGVETHVSIEHKRVFAMREFDGRPHLVSVALCDFEGVALKKTGQTFALVLLHEDRELTLDLWVTTRLGDALDCRDDYARLWALPAIEISIEGTITGPARRLGKIIAKTPRPRRAGAFRRGRPRFLVRRHTGFQAPPYSVGGDEIIARN